ncbi:MAG: zf-HC2 domain-containing protein [Candidatus Krumholzibacteria bacterium]|nr:zf-HC2 domain-containing protein [Candidatus Krumholzibacteria bacterium]
MSCNRMESDGMRYLDHEMTADEIAGFEKHLAECDTCRLMMEDLGRLDAFTGRMKIKDPVDTFMEGYWKSIYRRFERKTAWIVILAGASVAVLYFLIMMFREIGKITIGTGAMTVLLAGLIVLLISVIRERIHQKKADRYKDIVR